MKTNKEEAITRIGDSWETPVLDSLTCECTRRSSKRILRNYQSIITYHHEIPDSTIKE